jgi:hypothetical protein
LLLHLAGDLMPHEDIFDRKFEIGSGIAAVLLLAAARGPLDPAVTGALAASAPDLEHVVRFPRPGGRKLFPSHRLHGWHRSGGVPAPVQLLAAGLLVGMLVSGAAESGTFARLRQRTIGCRATGSTSRRR